MDDLDQRLPPEWRRARRGSATPWMLWLLTLTLLGVGGYVGLGLFQTERAANEAAKHELAQAMVRMRALETRRAELEGRRTELESRNAELTEKASALENEKGSLTAVVEQKDVELAQLRETYTTLQDKMKQEIAHGEIRLTQAAGRIQVELVDRILFDSGQSEVTEKGAGVLTRLGAVLSKLDDKLIQVSGHTDDSPIKDKELQLKFPTNWELSVSRAVNVVRYLSEKTGVPAKRLVAAGHGEYLPAASNATREGRARNRRIEVLLTPLLERKAAAIAASPKR